jgi:succinate dehydrogenase / fumarate reductase flavoprotein subunit
MWEHCGMARTASGLETALERIPALREEFWKNGKVVGGGSELNQVLERAGRIIDFLELGELMCRDALAREESCGGHFREEHQTTDGEARRNDADFSHVSVWEYTAESAVPVEHREHLEFEYVTPSQRSYK